MDSGLLSYKDRWIRCLAVPQNNGSWDCVVYVFVSDPRVSKQSPDDSCFQTMRTTCRRQRAR